MNAEFNWWLLIVGLVAGAGLVWLVVADWSRREEDVAEDERAVESAWIANTLHERGSEIDPDAAQEVLDLHREYLRQAGTLDQDAPAEWDDSTDEPAWPAERETGDSAGGAAPADSRDDVPADVAAPAEPAWPAMSDGPVPNRSSAPSGPATPSVRAAPLSPRGTASTVRGERDPEQRQP